MSRMRWAWIGIVSAGCAGAPAEPPSVPTPSAERPEARAEASAADAAAEPTGSLTLSQALALALVGSPELAAESWGLRASEAREIQAGLRPNPELGVLVENVLGSGIYRRGDEAQTTLQLSQAVELGGKRRARLAAAAAGRALAGAAYEAKRIEVLSRTTEHFIHLVADQHRLKLAEAGVKLAEESLAAARRRVESGKASAIEEKRSRVLLGRARIALEHAEHELLSTRRLLSATWGSAAPRFDVAEGDLLSVKAVPSLESLAARISGSPEIARWITEERLREAERRLAGARRVPDLTVTGGIRRLEGTADEALVLGISLPLPVSDRNQGGIAEAGSLARKAHAERRAAELRLGAALHGLYQELRHSVTQIESLRTEIIPRAEESLALARGLFEQGKLSQVELLDAQRTLLEVRQELIESAAVHHQYVVEIEKLIGAPLQGDVR